LPKVLPDAAPLMELNQGGADEVGYYTDKNFRKFKDLMSRKYFSSFLKKDKKKS